MTALQRMIDRCLILSQRQEKAIQEVTARRQIPRRAGFNSDLTELAIYERVFRDEALRIGRELIEMGRKDPFLAFESIKLLRLAARAMQRTIDWSEDRPVAQVRNEASLGLTWVNAAIMKLLESMNNLSQAQAASNMESYFQSLRQLIQQQKNLNQQARELMRKRGKMPNWMQQMKRLAEQQASIRRRIEELYRKYGKLEQLLGQLDEVGKQMKDLEEEMETAGDEERMKKKQEEIMTRLLDAEKSVHEQGFAKRRQSETAEEYEAGQPGQLPESDQSVDVRIKKLREGLGDAEVPPAFRNRVRRYFEKLSEEGSPQTSGATQVR
jgi:chromosome segregation ATPase